MEPDPFNLDAPSFTPKQALEPKSAIFLRNPKYKTKVCKAFHLLGECPYGRRCNFQHCHNSSVGFTQATSFLDMLLLYHEFEPDEHRLPVFETLSQPPVINDVTSPLRMMIACH
eukprot:gnl/Trimastix_PCT/1283.p1 GENE.gnl/Trimastix_PCT/1283~~gnl/Trimastix_PCT/1283.p1  ORF type:complete len:131 (-),score=30.44 gnl/Trimastix_PCT/1283:179-520(-)